MTPPLTFGTGGIRLLVELYRQEPVLLQSTPRIRGRVARFSWDKGEKPTDLPVQQSVKLKSVVNLSSAKTLVLTCAAYHADRRP